MGNTCSPLCSLNMFPEHFGENPSLYNSNLSIRGTFLLRLLPPPDIRVLHPTPKETYDLNLSKVTSSIWSFLIPRAIFCTKNWYNLGSLPSSEVELVHNDL